MAETITNPLDVAREILRRMARQRMAPTPENYRIVYHQVTQTPPTDAFPDKEFKTVVAGLPRNNPEQIRLIRKLEAAAKEHNWHAVKQSLNSILQEVGMPELAWTPMIKNLLQEFERRQIGFSPNKKKEALEETFTTAGKDNAQLYTRLQILLRDWSVAPSSRLQSEVGTEESNSLPPSNIVLAQDSTELAAAPQAWRDMFADILETAIGMLLIDTPELSDEAQNLANQFREPTHALNEAFDQQLQKFAYRVRWVVEDQGKIREALLNLLQLIIENIGELIDDEKWLQGQVDSVLDLFAVPLDKNMLDELGKRLKEVIYKQGALKKNLNDARERMKEMLAVFVEQLSSFSDSTGSYHSKMEVFAQRTSQASSIEELSSLIQEVMQETRQVQLKAQESQSELSQLRLKVDASNVEIARLQQELEEASEMVRHDQLTGALNRKGLDEAMEREVARMRRKGTALSIALLDVDNFKRLNDTHGHHAGDQALIHLAEVIKDTLRPQDAVARYGGEEFLILLPDTDVDSALRVIQRLQRTLTRRFFLHDNQKLLITFSAGIALLHSEEKPHDAIERADAAMYQAKRDGKNRAIIAQPI